MGLVLTLGLFQHHHVEANGLPNDFSAYPDTTRSLADSTLLSADSTEEEAILPFPIKYHATDSIRVEVDSQVVYLYGKARVDYDDLQLTADFIRIDMNRKEVSAEGLPDSTGALQGKPEFSQGAQEFKATSMRYNFESKKGKISYVITSEGDGYIHGETVKKDPENNFYIRNGQYTTCDQEHPHFSITSNKLKVIKDDKIVTGPAYLSIEDIPTPLAIPFGFFPNKQGRSSGIIFPGFGESAERGFYFQRLGYYFGFSDYFNLSLTTDLYTKGSYTIDLGSQYRSRYRFNGNLRLSYAYTAIGEKDLPDYSYRKDFHVSWSHSQDPKANPNHTFSANVNAGTSNYYQNTISSLNNYLSNTFQSSITYTQLFPDKPINLTLAMNHWQNTITNDIRITLPDVSFGVSRFNPFKRKVQSGRVRWYEKIGGSYTMRGTNFIQTKDSLLFRQQSLDQMQNGMQHSLPFSTSINLLKYITVSPSINYTERWYLKTTEYDWNNEQSKVDTITREGFKASRDYSISVGMLTRVYGMFQYRKGPVAAIRHVMTPSVSFSFRPDFSEARYGYYKQVQVDTSGRTSTYSIFQNGVYGGPSAGKFGALNFSFDNNLEMKVRTKTDSGEVLKKIKLLESLRFNSSYNLIADSMKWSPVGFSGRTTFANKMIMTFGGTLDPYAYDENNRDYNRYLVDETGRLFRLTNANLAFNFSLAGKTNAEKLTPRQINEYVNDPASYVNFDIPYSLYVGYNMNYSKRGTAEANLNQSITFNGDLSLTPKWKIGFNSWYDVVDGEFTSFSTSIYRDLHCWEMRMNWIPFGGQESYSFQINVKSAMLQDLKLNKRKDFFN
ncbi:MAG: putative LPS assembly protein LptD [Bacteroidota bacterium]